MGYQRSHEYPIQNVIVQWIPRKSLIEDKNLRMRIFLWHGIGMADK